MRIAVLRLLSWWETVTCMAKRLKLSGGKREEHKGSVEGKLKEHGGVVVVVVVDSNL
jgi:hypothetical protein